MGIAEGARHMDISTFYAVTSATCLGLVGLWWSVVEKRTEWHANEEAAV